MLMPCSLSLRPEEDYDMSALATLIRQQVESAIATMVDEAINEAITSSLNDALGITPAVVAAAPAPVRVRNANTPAHLRQSSASKGHKVYSASPYGKTHPLTFGEYVERQDVNAVYGQKSAQDSASTTTTATVTRKLGKVQEWKSLPSKPKADGTFTYTRKRGKAKGQTRTYQVLGQVRGQYQVARVIG